MKAQETAQAQINTNKIRRAESKALEKRWIRAFLPWRAQKCKCCHSKRAAPPVLGIKFSFVCCALRNIWKNQTSLLVPARLCVTLQEPDSGDGKGPIFAFGLPGDRSQRGLRCLRAAEPISLVILWMGHFPALLGTVRPQLAFISSKLLRLNRRIQEEFIS